MSCIFLFCRLIAMKFTSLKLLAFYSFYFVWAERSTRAHARGAVSTGARRRRAGRRCEARWDVSKGAIDAEVYGDRETAARCTGVAAADHDD